MAKIVLTGASYGLGREIAIALAGSLSASTSPVEFLLVARSVTELETCCAEVIKAGAAATFVAADIGTEQGCFEVILAAEKQLGHVDIFVSCAALSPFMLFDELPAEQIRRVIAVNLLAPLTLARTWLPQMIANKSGKILVLSSMAGKYGIPLNAAYSASKSGLVQWIQALRNELQGTGVDVRVLCPMSVVVSE